MCFNFLTGRTGPSVGPTSSADKAAGYLVDMAGPRRAVNPMSAAQRATQNKQTADRNTVRRADSYGGAPKRGDETKPGAWGGATDIKPTNKLTPAPVNVPGAEKIKQTFQTKTAQRIADNTAVKKKKKKIVRSTSSYAPLKSWQVNQTSGTTILGSSSGTKYKEYGLLQKMDRHQG